MTTPQSSPPADLGLTIPLIAAPMAGGATTPAMVIRGRPAPVVWDSWRPGTRARKAWNQRSPRYATHRSRSVGQRLRTQRRPHHRRGLPPLRADALKADADRFGLTLPPHPIDDDDAFDAKIEVLVSNPGPGGQFHLRATRSRCHQRPEEGRHGARPDRDHAARSRAGRGSRRRHAGRSGQCRWWAFRHVHPGPDAGIGAARRSHRADRHRRASP